jgi:hypothetical protein
MVPEGDPGVSERFRIDALERWRDKVDDERGTIMGDLGMIRGLLEGLKEDFDDVKTRLSHIEDKLEERPSRAEIQRLDRDVDSLRAKANNKIRGWTKFEVTGPGGMKFKLLGVSGVTIVLVLLLAVIGVTLILLLKK